MAGPEADGTDAGVAGRESVRRPEPPPIRTLCMICGAVLVDVPLDARGVSHGVCSAEEWAAWRKDKRDE